MVLWPELVLLLRQRDLCRVDELVKVSRWAPCAMASVAFKPNGVVA